MGKGEELATAFEQVNQTAIQTIQGLNADALKRTTSAEGWTVAATARHVASGTEGILAIVQGITSGAEMPPFTPEMLDQQNAENAAKDLSADLEGTLEILRDSGAKAAAALRSLSDEDLSKSAPLFGNQMSASDVVQGILIGHIQGHLPSISST